MPQREKSCSVLDDIRGKLSSDLGFTKSRPNSSELNRIDFSIVASKKYFWFM
jgi:hypothetical protein